MKIKERLAAPGIFKIWLYLFVIAPSIFGCTSRHITNDVKASFFFQMTDPQFGMFTNDSGFEKETIEGK